jgi:hypothetical protein
LTQGTQTFRANSWPCSDDRRERGGSGRDARAQWRPCETRHPGQDLGLADRLVVRRFDGVTSDCQRGAIGLVSEADDLVPDLFVSPS